MGIELLTERLKDQIAGVLGCWDRVLIFGTLPKICYAEGMTSYLYAKQVIKKVAHGYKYYVTTFGKDILAAGLKLRELMIIPQLAYGRVP